MPPQESASKLKGDWLDLNLPVPDAPWPRFPDLPLGAVDALNEQLWEQTVYDDAYFERSLKSKNPEPFVL